MPKARHQKRTGTPRVQLSGRYDPRLERKIEADRDRFTTREGRPSRSLVLAAIAEFHYFGSGEVVTTPRRGRPPLYLAAARRRVG
jgi:hypothetical protein